MKFLLFELRLSVSPNSSSSRSRRGELVSHVWHYHLVDLFQVFCTLCNLNKLLRGRKITLYFPTFLYKENFLENIFPDVNSKRNKNAVDLFDCFITTTLFTHVPRTRTDGRMDGLSPHFWVKNSFTRARVCCSPSTCLQLLWAAGNKNVVRSTSTERAEAEAEE